MAASPRHTRPLDHSRTAELGHRMSWSTARISTTLPPVGLDWWTSRRRYDADEDEGGGQLRTNKLSVWEGRGHRLTTSRTAFKNTRDDHCPPSLRRSRRTCCDARGAGSSGSTSHMSFCYPSPAGAYVTTFNSAAEKLVVR